MIDLLKNGKWSVLSGWTTGCTTKASNPLDTSGMESVTFVLTVPQTTTITSFALQGSATTTVGDFQALSLNSSAISISSTVTGGIQLIQVNKPHPSYRYLRTVVNSTGITSQGQVIAIGCPVRYAPTTFVSTEVLASIQAASPTT